MSATASAKQIRDDVVVAANRRNDEVLRKAFGHKIPQPWRCKPPCGPLFVTSSTPGPTFISESTNAWENEGGSCVELERKLERNPGGCTINNCPCPECNLWDVGVAEDLLAVHGADIFRCTKHKCHDPVLGHDDYNCECGRYPPKEWGGFSECDLHHRMDCPTCA